MVDLQMHARAGPFRRGLKIFVSGWILNRRGLPNAIAGRPSYPVRTSRGKATNQMEALFSAFQPLHRQRSKMMIPRSCVNQQLKTNVAQNGFI